MITNNFGSIMLQEYVESDDIELIETINDPHGNSYFLIYEKANNLISFRTTAKNAVNSFKSFIKKYPFLSGTALAVGMDALDSYKQSKRLTTRFFAQTPVEKKLYKKISDDLVSTGKYKLVKTKKINGGILYELKRDKL